MTARLANVTFDCDDVLAVARFWSEVLGRPLAAEPQPSEHFAMIGTLDHDAAGTPQWLFQKVPEQKEAKNRCHVDLVAPDRPAEVARLVDLGATKVGDKDEYGFQWTVMQDVEGNEFCIAGE
ncbi:MAG TPA: VOC family protein [Acidimicrobiales bacterium]|nr:VOC family protein [Acidimicrobiales bacterium]